MSNQDNQDNQMTATSEEIVEIQPESTDPLVKLLKKLNNDPRHKAALAAALKAMEDNPND